MNFELSDALVDAILKVGRISSCDRVMLIGTAKLDVLIPLKSKLLYCVSQPHRATELRADGYDVVIIPSYTASRTDRLKAALVGGVSTGLLSKGQSVLCAISRDEGGPIDTVMHLTSDETEEEHGSLVVTRLANDLPPQLLEVVVNLALRIGREGYEGRPLGTLIVVGSSTEVMERSHPLALNPFQGYSEAERNLFDTHVRDAVRMFAMLDGAFVVRDDGVVLAAGRHIRIGDAAPKLPLGYGSRHVAAAAISRDTKAIAIAVSQSSGEVRIFRGGELVLEIAPSGRRSETPIEYNWALAETGGHAVAVKAPEKPVVEERRERKKTSTKKSPAKSQS